MNNISSFLSPFFWTSLPYPSHPHSHPVLAHPDQIKIEIKIKINLLWYGMPRYFYYYFLTVP